METKRDGQGEKNEQDICECGCKNFTEDVAKAEKVCDDCGLTTELLSDDDQTNAGQVYGDERQTERVDPFANNRNDGLGTHMPILSPGNDGNGKSLSPAARRRYRRMAQHNRSTHRPKDPMCRNVKLKIREMVGPDIARATAHIVDASCQKLKPWQEEERQKMKTSEKKALNCPKTSITRKKVGIKGESDEQNLQIIGLAIVKLGHRWLNTPHVDLRPLMKQFTISDKQISNAVSTISRGYKARAGKGWAPSPQQLNAAVKRDDEADQAIAHLAEDLSEKLTQKELDEVMKVFFEMMNAIGEPDIEGHLNNVPISMVVGCVMYSALKKVGLAKGNLDRVARAVGFTGAGVKNRLAQTKAEVESGEFSEGKALFANKRSSDRFGESEKGSSHD
mgnify:CR=1 FL=1